MKVTILRESGYIEAIKGIGLSRGITDFNRLEQVAKRLAFQQGGHNKFLESMSIWIEMKAPRYFWQEFDTYRIGMTKQSSSTIYSMTRREMLPEDCTPETPRGSIAVFNEELGRYKRCTSGSIKHTLFKTLKSALPEGFEQNRILRTNYKTLQNIVVQRTGHKLDEWGVFIEILRSGLEHPYFIFREV